MLTGLKALPWSLYLVWNGSLLPEDKALAEALGLKKRVRFLGAWRVVAELLVGAQVFVLASKWEGLPLSILEAMRARLTMVATDVVGVREAVEEERTGFLVPRGDEEALRERLARLLQDTALRLYMGTSGRRRYEEAFTLYNMLEGVYRVYEEVLDSGTPT
ncbi:MAG: glycosyltransferase [Clostridiales bacterium]|nr:glycosyltransferase [Clostridiales bacterium]